jgi:hypothetical protein
VAVAAVVFATASIAVDGVMQVPSGGAHVFAPGPRSLAAAPR